jgi:hypothetical protein
MLASVQIFSPLVLYIRNNEETNNARIATTTTTITTTNILFIS